MTKELTDWLTGNLGVFGLTFVRVLSMVSVAPVFSWRVIPGRVKVGVALFATVAIYPMVRGGSASAVTVTVATFVGQVVSELTVGLALGFGAAIVFAGIELAGEVISRQMGTDLAGVFNPGLDGQTPVMSRFYSLFAVMIFLGMNGHHGMIEVLMGTFRRIPLGDFRLSGDTLGLVTGLLGDSFVLAVQVAAPVLVSLVLVTIVLGMVSRTVPQMNVLVAGFPVQVAVGLVVSMVTLGAVALVFQGAFGRMLGTLHTLSVAPR